MGKEWLSWVGGGGGGGGGGNSKRGKMGGGEASGGCMCAVFQLFHVHHFHFPSTHRNHSSTHPFLQEEATTTTGVEAPRNSLELNEKQEADLNFPVGIKIKTSRLVDISSECDSPGTKTPSVVARLMGLDLLPQPQCTSPSLTKSRKDTTLLQIDAARSLPETPRTSSSSRKSDVERHRLSLQINKENASSLSDCGGGRRGRFKQDDKRRPVALDITNTHRNSTTDQNLNLNPSKKNSKIDGNQSNAPKVQRNSSSSYDINHQSRRVSNQIPLKESKKVRGKCSSSSRLKKLPASRREDGFVRSREGNKAHLAQNKCKRTPLSCNIRNVNGPTLAQGKINGAAPPLAKLPQKQSQVSDALSWKSSTQLSSKPSQPYSQLQLQPCSTNGGAAGLHGGASPEHRNYIQIILKHTGIINQVNPLAKWHAPSQPIDPGIFHDLEVKVAAAYADGGCNAGLSRRCERNLIFQLVDELLAEILTRHWKLNRWIFPVGGDGGYRLVEELCKKIESVPAAKCVVLEDIDSLIDTDLSKPQWNGFWGEEEEMMGEIEGEIVEWLVREAVAVMGGGAAEEHCHEARCMSL